MIIHGRSRSRVDAAVAEVNAAAAEGGGVEGAYVRDLSSLDGVRQLARDVLNHHPRLDVLDNNAGVFEPRRVVTVDGFERTFQVNVLTPYLLTGLLLPRLARTAAVDASRDVRILNVASISQTPGVEWDNLNAEKAFTDHDSYCRSKTCVKLFSFALHERLARAARGETHLAASELSEAGADALANVSVITCDPGTVNTKMLLAGWGPCGIETYQANDQFELLTQPRFAEEDTRGGYFVNLAMRQRPGGPKDATADEREKLWGVLEDATGFRYPL